MTSVYRYLFGSSSNGAETSTTTTTATAKKQSYWTRRSNNDPTETTSLLHTAKNGDHDDDPEKATSTPPQHDGVSVQEFFFPSENPTIQQYYRFTSNALTPIAALHKRPGPSSTPNNNNQQSPAQHGGVTGLLRRTAVVPSHGTDASGEWILVSVGGRSGWARKKTQQQTALAGFLPAHSFRATEAWMGNHAFLCGGRVMLGSDAPSLFFTNALIVVAFVFHALVIIPELKRVQETHELPPLFFLDSPAAMFWTSLFLVVVSLILLWMTAVTDPGILPAVSSPFKPPVPDDGTPIGGPLGYKYCSTCNIFRPPRSKHCNSCNVCVSKFDHHCPWVGNCVGERNHRFFFWFLMSICGLAILTTAAVVVLFLAAYQEISVVDSPGIGPVMELNYTDLGQVTEYGERTSHRLWTAVMSMPFTFLFGTFTFLCTWSLTSLLGYHALIMTLAQTTNERVRGVYRYGSAVNTANRGCCVNWWTALCSKRPPSRLPRSFADCCHTDPSRLPESPWTHDTQVSMSRGSSGGSLGSMM